MATLNIKSFPDAVYRKVRARAKRARRSVTQEVIQILADAVEEPPALSILDLRGLGKEVWKGVDASRHVARERRRWD